MGPRETQARKDEGKLERTGAPAVGWVSGGRGREDIWELRGRGTHQGPRSPKGGEQARVQEILGVLQAVVGAFLEGTPLQLSHVGPLTASLLHPPGSLSGGCDSGRAAVCIEGASADQVAGGCLVTALRAAAW